MVTPDTELLLDKSLDVIDEAVGICRYARIAPLFSGGHDSYCACFVASQHRKFDGNVYHINTGIGSKATRDFVEQVCKDEGWKLNILKSPNTYEDRIRESGFPGPAMHSYTYHALKERCVNMITKIGKSHHPTILVTGARAAESRRRMGHVVPVRVGEVYQNSNGRASARHRIWTAPCYDWSSEDQHDFMNLHQMPRNPVKQSILGMSGECFCGAFARPNEIDMIREVVPDVAAEIDRLQIVAQECGHPPDRCVYGGPRNKGEQILETGPLCTSCDNKARQAGLNIIQR